MKSPKSLLKQLAAVCGSLLFLTSAAQSATHVWSGLAINDLFSMPGNWSSGGVPAAGETALVLVFPADSYSLTPLDNIPGLAVDGITFAGGGLQSARRWWCDADVQASDCRCVRHPLHQLHGYGE